VTFHVGHPEAPQHTRNFVVDYEIDASDGRGYIYLPRGRKDLIYHGIEGKLAVRDSALG
jgi:hypothetical protein